MIALLAVGSSLAQEEESPAPSAEGGRAAYLIRVPLPIDGQIDADVRQAVRRALDDASRRKAQPTVVLDFRVAKNQDEFGRGSQFGPTYELADFLASPETAAARVVAFVPQSIAGHAVLAVLAADEIVMAPDAALGDAAIDEDRISPGQRSAYTEIASRRNTIPAPVALGLLDPEQEVLDVTTEVSREFVTRQGLAKLEKDHTIRSSEVLIPAGQAGKLRGEDLRRLGMVSYLAENRTELARALDLPPEALRDDPSLGGDWRAVRVDVKGPIRAATVDSARKLIEDQVRLNDVNLVFVAIDSPGGSPVDSVQLANFLAFQLDPGKVRTVAYVPEQARADAALIALACDDVLIGPRAVLGGPGAHEFTAPEIQQTTAVVREELAPRQGRAWSLPVATFDPDLEVFRYTHLDQVGYFSEAEAKALPDADAWKQGAAVTTPGSVFSAKGDEAVQFQLARRVVNSAGDLVRLYGLEGDPAHIAPSWTDLLVRALASPWMAALLFIVGGAAMYVELQTPGIGLGGFLAAVCFALFFWSRFLGGTAGWLEVILFAIGVVCVLLEIFVLPGFGVFGLGGGLLILVSLVLASQTFVLPRNPYQFGRVITSLWTVIGGVAGAVAAIVLLHRWLPKAPVLNRLFLEPFSPAEAEEIRRREALADYSDLLGQEGVATTVLKPGGKVRIGDREYSVVSDGDVVPRGARVVVIEARGNHVVVQSLL